LQLDNKEDMKSLFSEKEIAMLWRVFFYQKLHWIVMKTQSMTGKVLLREFLDRGNMQCMLTILENYDIWGNLRVLYHAYTVYITVCTESICSFLNNL
jgi:hypothetical protein